ncbi:FeoC like transcriptional regulator [Clostridium collagenovorans DSM 3089]|uniref:FeoC like transcriptional regulator n=1 Tax=Clostridium collagenovorans DSM 3089 TaxID=1121306 RepID=A0A1M5X4Q5_9CLOT|nr:FeoC-like transcriptional regulator [Clostridium collagenovorans]SHH94494.1 FeoC like transcriptional regulator [Clostridium collagenovorans DSM 3089]
MLKELLIYIDATGDFSSKNLAKKFNISEYLAEEYKLKLVSMGYIQKVQGSCTSEMCKSCGCGCSGKVLNGTINWEITGKGKESLKKS